MKERISFTTSGEERAAKRGRNSEAPSQSRAQARFILNEVFEEANQTITQNRRCTPPSR